MFAFEHKDNHYVSIPGINSCQLKHWNERHVNRWTVIITVVGTDTLSSSRPKCSALTCPSHLFIYAASHPSPMFYVKR